MLHLNFREEKKDFEKRINGARNAYPVLENGKVAVDIGANHGAFSVAYHSKFEKIFCIEPSYNTFQVLLKNLQKYAAKNVAAYNLGISNKTGQILQLRHHISNLASCASTQTYEKFGWNKTEEYESVMSINLEDIYKLFQIDFIDYLKIDCEGSEYIGLMNQDLSKINYLALELHVQLENKMFELREYIEKYFEKITEKGDGVKRHYEILYKKK